MLFVFSYINKAAIVAHRQEVGESSVNTWAGAPV